MKKFLVIALVSVLLLSLSACNTEKEENTPADTIVKEIVTNADSDSEAEDDGDIVDIEIDENGDDSGYMPEFVPPAETGETDLLPNENVELVYDDNGRISVCYYEIDGDEVYQSYLYSDSTVGIYTFYGDVVIDIAEFSYAADDADAEIFVKDGYYFKGITFDGTSDDSLESNNSASFEGMITDEEAVSLVRDMVGDEYGLRSEGLVDRDGVAYYSIRMTWLVDGTHSSTINQYLVKADGSEVVDYFE